MKHQYATTRLFGVLTIVTLGSIGAAEAAPTYTYTTPVFITSGFDADDGGYTTFRGADLEMQRSSSTAADIQISSSYTATFSADAPFNNPPQVAGTRPLWNLSFDTDDGNLGQLTWNFDFLAEGGLRTTDYMVFRDFDFDEEVSIKAFDLSNTLIDFDDLVFEIWPGQQTPPDAPNSLSDWYSFSEPTGYSGKIAATLGGNSDSVVITVRSTSAISRLSYEFALNPTGSSERNSSVSFNFAALDAVSDVPEPGTSGLVLAGAIAAAATRRRQTAGSHTVAERGRGAHQG